MNWLPSRESLSGSRTEALGEVPFVVKPFASSLILSVFRDIWYETIRTGGVTAPTQQLSRLGGIFHSFVSFGIEVPSVIWYNGVSSVGKGVRV